MNNKSNVHSISGNVVGTSDNQTLTNKNISNLISPISINDGGTGSETPSGARINLDTQQQNSNLDDISNMTPTNNNFIIGNGVDFTLLNPVNSRISLGLGTIATRNETEFVETTISTSVSAGGVQEIQSSLSLIDDNNNTTLDLDGEYGSVGFFGTNAPSGQGLVNNLNTLSASLSGGDTVDLTDLYNTIEDIHIELQNIIDILKNHGLSI